MSLGCVANTYFFSVDVWGVGGGDAATPQKSRAHNINVCMYWRACVISFFCVFFVDVFPWLAAGLDGGGGRDPGHSI